MKPLAVLVENAQDVMNWKMLHTMPHGGVAFVLGPEDAHGQEFSAMMTTPTFFNRSDAARLYELVLTRVR